MYETFNLEHSTKTQENLKYLELELLHQYFVELT